MNSAPQNYSNETSSQLAAQKKSNALVSFFNTMRKGIRAANAAQAYSYDKDAILRILSEDK